MPLRSVPLLYIVDTDHSRTVSGTLISCVYTHMVLLVLNFKYLYYCSVTQLYNSNPGYSCMYYLYYGRGTPVSDLVYVLQL